MATFGDAVCSGEIVAVPQPISENPKDAKMAIARTKKSPGIREDIIIFNRTPRPCNSPYRVLDMCISNNAMPLECLVIKSDDVYRTISSHLLDWDPLEIEVSQPKLGHA